MDIELKNDSRRHHYLPVFYLKKFTDEDGCLYVYNKEKDEILKEKKSSKSMFFEWNRNTTSIGEVQMTIIEDLYSNLDSKFSKIYNEILLANYDNPTLREMRIIKNKCLLFINFIRWRVPARDKIVLNILNKYNFEDLYYYIGNAKTGLPVEDETIISAFKSLNFLNKSQAALIITVPFDNIEHVEGVSNSTELHSQSAYPSLICDNPYIEKNPTEDIKIFNEFIFPLTKYDFVIYSKTFTGSTLNQDFALAMELAKLENAEKYVACADRDHLIKLTNAYREMRKKNLNEFIIPNLFKFLD